MGSIESLKKHLQQIPLTNLKEYLQIVIKPLVPPGTTPNIRKIRAEIYPPAAITT